jgi:hypothetical protein
MQLIRALLAQQPPLNRYRLSLAVCERLNWRRPDGRLKEMSCRVAMLRMQADGLFTLPPPRRAQPPAFKMSAVRPKAIPVVGISGAEMISVKPTIIFNRCTWNTWSLNARRRWISWHSRRDGGFSWRRGTSRFGTTSRC